MTQHSRARVIASNNTGRVARRNSHRDATTMPLQAALGSFLAEFDRFETQGVRSALRSLTQDTRFAEQSEQLLDLGARLTLLERLAAARALPSGPDAALHDLLSSAHRLLGLRHAVERVPSNLATGDLDTPPLIVRRRPGGAPGRPGEPDAVWIPGTQQLQAYAHEAARLNASLCAMAAHFSRA